MSGIIKGRRSKLILFIIAAATAAAVFAIIYYSGILLPHYAVWHDVTISGDDENEPDEIILKNRRLKVYKDGVNVFEAPKSLRVQNVLYTDIDRDGSREMILLNFNLGRYGDHRPFWVRFDPSVWRQHIYIYDYYADKRSFRPIWMASDIGMEAADCVMEDKQVLMLTDSNGVQTRWMWISFGLRCVD